MPNSHQFEFVIGVNPGYQHANDCKSPLEAVAKAWDEAAESQFAGGALYIPVTMHQGKAVYRREWGCPSGGEDIVIVRGVLNPDFVAVQVAWSAAVMLICQAVKEALNQTTATFTLTPCEFCYMKNEATVLQ